LDNADLKIYHCNEFEGSQQIKKYFPTNDGNIDWYSLLHMDNSLFSNAFTKSVKLLENNIENKKNDLIKSILKEPVIIF
jgi:hypothetical protein